MQQLQSQTNNKMGNECPECDTPSNDCKMRDVFKQQPKNRDDLDLSHIKKGQYKRKSRKVQYEEDQSFPIPQLILESNIVEKTHRKVEQPKKIQKTTQAKKQKVELAASALQPIPKPLSLDPETQTIQIKRGVKYIGGTIDGQPHERGKILWQDGTTLIGQFFLGQMAQHEKIILQTKDRGSYQGEILEGRANSKGKIILPDGSSYDGEWKEDLPHGYGKHKMSDGSFYEGNFIKGEKSGKGRFYFDEGVFDGVFSNDEFNGEGLLTMNDGRMIRGEWRGGILQGKGQIEWASGEKYIGTFSRGMRDGQGTYWFADGREWTGEWQNDMQNGFGCYQLPSGQTVKGIWVGGIKKDEMRDRAFE